MSVKGFYHRARAAMRAAGRRVQSAVVRWALTALYFAGMGAVRLWVRIFHPILLDAGRAARGWLDPDTRDFDEEESLRQS